MDCSAPGFPVRHQLPELAQTHVHWVSIFPSIRVFSNELALCIRWPKYWSFSISPSNEYSGLISFRIDWFDLSAVQGTLKSLLQHHSSKASILRCSVFFYFPALTSLHDYWKNHNFDCVDLWGKVMSLLFNMLCSVQFSCSIVFNSLQAHGLQHGRHWWHHHADDMQPWN